MPSFHHRSLFYNISRQRGLNLRWGPGPLPHFNKRWKMNDYIVNKIKQELKDYAVDAGTIQDIVTLLNNETQDVVARRTALEKELMHIAYAYIDIIMNEWRLIGGSTPLPSIYREDLGVRAAALANDFANEIIRYQQKEAQLRNE